MNQLNRTCIVCGTKYKYCGHCGQVNHEETWRNNYCCENCRDIYRVVAAYGVQELSAKEAYEKLSKLDLSSADNYTEAMKRLIGEINSVKPVEVVKAPTQEFKKPNNKQYNNKQNKKR